MTIIMTKKTILTTMMTKLSPHHIPLVCTEGGGGLPFLWGPVRGQVLLKLLHGQNLMVHQTVLQVPAHSWFNGDMMNSGV